MKTPYFYLLTWFISTFAFFGCHFDIGESKKRKPNNQDQASPQSEPDTNQNGQNNSQVYQLSSKENEVIQSAIKRYELDPNFYQIQINKLLSTNAKNVKHVTLETADGKRLYINLP